MTRLQLRRVFNRHYGEGARVARELNLSRTSVYRWFQGHIVSARIDAAVRKRAFELLDQERALKNHAETPVNLGPA